MKKFTQLADEAASCSASSLSKMTGVVSRINIINIHVKTLAYQFSDMASDAYVTAISLPIRGDIKGSTLLMFPKDISMKLASLLTQEACSSKHGFDAMEVSALKEVGNIVCGSFLTVLANRLNIHVVEHLPVFIFDTLSTVLNQLELQTIDNSEEALLVEVRFEFEKTDISGYVILAFGLSDMQVIDDALDKADMTGIDK